MKRQYNNGIPMSKEGGKGSRRRRSSPDIPQKTWDSIFKKKEKKDDK
jgi:hypothetical protein